MRPRCWLSTRLCADFSGCEAHFSPLPGACVQPKARCVSLFSDSRSARKAYVPPSFVCLVGLFVLGSGRFGASSSSPCPCIYLRRPAPGPRGAGVHLGGAVSLQGL